MFAVEPYSGDVVDSVFTLFDDALDLSKAELSTIVFLPRRARDEAKISDREYYGVENRFVPLVEGAVYKNLIARVSHAAAGGPLLAGHE